MNTAVDKANGVGDHPLSVAAIAIVVGGSGLGCSRGEDYQLPACALVTGNSSAKVLMRNLAVRRCSSRSRAAMAAKISGCSLNVDDVVSRKLGEIG